MPVRRQSAPEMATILLVDDDPNILCPLQLLVERAGYRVVTAQNGEAALAAAALVSPNLVVTDWMMPRLDGVGLCRRLRDDATTEHLGDAFLLKPTSIARLLKMMRTLLEKPRRDPERPHAIE
jgi:DNA-binding response OmpR family regulator